MLTCDERRFLTESWRLSLLSIVAAVMVAGPAVDPLWSMFAGYGLAVGLGLYVGWRSKARKNGGKVERVVFALFFRIDWRPWLLVVLVGGALAFLAGALKETTVRTGAIGDPNLSADAALLLISGVLADLAVWSDPAYVAVVVGGPVLALSAGFYDGAWAGAASARAGIRPWQVLPWERHWDEWRTKHRLRRREYWDELLRS